LDSVNGTAHHSDRVNESIGPTLWDLSVASTDIQMVIARLSAALDITPLQMVEIESRIGKTTNQTAADRLGKTVSAAKQIVAWLNDFIAIEIQSRDGRAMR
jgi:hypothetical protein